MPQDTPTTPELPDPIQQLRQIEQDHRRFLRLGSPVRASLWMALMRPVDELMARESFLETTQAPDGSVETRSIPAVLAWGETLVRKAIRGDMQAAGIIADRIEGKVGTRRDEEDPEDERRRGDMQGVIESIVTAMVNAKIAGADDSPEDSASDRTPVVIDAEAPRRLGDDAPEPRPPAVR